MARRKRKPDPPTPPATTAADVPVAPLDTPDTPAAQTVSTAAPPGRHPWDDPVESEEQSDEAAALIRYLASVTELQAKIDVIRDCKSVYEVLGTLAQNNWLTTQAKALKWLRR